MQQEHFCHAHGNNKHSQILNLAIIYGLLLPTASRADAQPFSHSPWYCSRTLGVRCQNVVEDLRMQVALFHVPGELLTCTSNNKYSQIHNLAAIHELHTPGPCRAGPQLPRKPHDPSPGPEPTTKKRHPQRTTASHTGRRLPLIGTMGVALVHPTSESDVGNLAAITCLGQRAGQ